jgi:hypothetical protein
MVAFYEPCLTWIAKAEKRKSARAQERKSARAQEREASGREASGRRCLVRQKIPFRFVTFATLSPESGNFALNDCF